jgi:protein-L-isoaspartate(D-aspartate) O-methyltransferase
MMLTGRSIHLREKMVTAQLEARGIDDRTVLDAMRRVPRENFIPGRVPLETVYGDYPLSIGFGQTISQPYIVAFMVWRLGLCSGKKVLEIGTGSGYQTAILAEMGLDVVTVEVIPQLALAARRVILEHKPESKVRFIAADGYHGWQPGAPYDGIIVSASPPELPGGLIEQLTDSGCIIMPVGGFSQQLVKVTRGNDNCPVIRALLGVRFVPLVDTSERRSTYDF